MILQGKKLENAKKKKIKWPNLILSNCISLNEILQNKNEQGPFSGLGARWHGLLHA